MVEFSNLEEFPTAILSGSIIDDDVLELNSFRGLRLVILDSRWQDLRIDTQKLINNTSLTVLQVESARISCAEILGGSVLDQVNTLLICQSAQFLKFACGRMTIHDFRATEITVDRTIIDWLSMQKLSNLQLNKVRIEDQDLGDLLHQCSSTLKSLWLSETAIALNRTIEMPQLMYLVLRYSSVSDHGVNSIINSCPKLIELDIEGNNVSYSGAKTLRNQLPNLKSFNSDYQELQLRAPKFFGRSRED